MSPDASSKRAAAAAEFGYSISRPRAIDMDSNDMTLATRVLEWEPTLKGCFDCGGCSATCTAAAFTGFNFRRLHHLMRMGEYDGIREEISKCMLCGKCRMVCPRGVNTRNVVIAILRTINERQP